MNDFLLCLWRTNSIYTCKHTHLCVHVYRHRAPIYNFSATISLRFILQFLIFAVLFPREPQKQTTNLSFSCFLLSPFEWGWDIENNVSLRSCCFAIKKHKLLDLGVGIRKSFLCTLHNTIIVLLLAQHDTFKTTLFSVDSNVWQLCRLKLFWLHWTYSHRILLHCKKCLYCNPV